MEHLAPLLQTLLWVGLITGILWRFHVPIYGILAALQKRLDEGSDVKVGPVAITAQLRPQDAKAVQEKVTEEVSEALQITSPGPALDTDAVAPGNLTRAAGSIQSAYLRAEDLVLRALQTEYGASVNRQVTAGADRGFDGAFVSNGRFNIVEVKYARSLRQIDRYRDSLARIASAVEGYGWRNAQVILAVVFERADDVGPGARLLESIAGGYAVPVIVRTYSLAELEQRFGFRGQE